MHIIVYSKLEENDSLSEVEKKLSRIYINFLGLKKNYIDCN